MTKKIKRIKYKVPKSAEYEFTGKRRVKIQDIDLKTGLSYLVDAIDDETNKKIIYKCRLCGQSQEWDKKNSTEDNIFSGLCSKCFIEENEHTILFANKIYFLRDPNTGIMRRPNPNEEWEIFYKNGQKKVGSKDLLLKEVCWTDDEIQKRFLMQKLSVNEDWHLIKFEESQLINPNFEISFESHDSIFNKIIINRNIDSLKEKYKKYEKWKRNNFEILDFLFSNLESSNDELLEKLEVSQNTLKFSQVKNQYS